MFSSFTKIFLIIGIIFLILAGVFYLVTRFNLPIGKLPGDIQIQGKGFTCLFPLASSIIVSIVLSVILTLITLLSGRK